MKCWFSFFPFFLNQAQRVAATTVIMWKLDWYWTKWLLICALVQISALILPLQTVSHGACRWNSITGKKKNKPTLMWERSPRLVFIGVCHSACLSAASRLSLFLTAFFHQASLLRPWFASASFTFCSPPFSPPTLLHQGVNWKPWKGHLISLDFTEMKIRPVGALSSRRRRWLANQSAGLH